MFRSHSHILATGTTKLRKQIEPRAHKKMDDSVIEDLKMETGVKDAQLDTKVMEDDDIARFFSEQHERYMMFPPIRLNPNEQEPMYQIELDMYLNSLRPSPDEQRTIDRSDPQSAMQEALKFWCRRDPSAATYRALVGITLDAHQARVAFRLCLHIKNYV